MLNNLDKINWNKLTHAYGHADDVPFDIKGLLSDDEDIYEKSLWHLYGNVYHQGSVYQATGYIMPFLLEILFNKVSKPAEIMILINHIIKGYTDNKEYLDKIFQEFENGLDIYTDYIMNGSLEEKITASYLLSCFKNYKKTIIDLYIVKFNNEDKIIKAVILLCASLLCDNETKIYDYFKSNITQFNDDFIKLAEYFSLIKVYKENIKDNSLNEINKLLSKPVIFYELQEINGMKCNSLTRLNLFYYLNGLNENQYALIIDNLIKILINETDGNNALDMAGALLSAVFKGFNRDNPVKDLSLIQKKVLTGFLKSNAVWEYSNIDLELKDHGINIKGLNTKKALAKYLNIDYFDPESVFDKAIELKDEGDYKNAFNNFIKLIEYNKNDPIYYHCAGHMKILSGEKEEAKKYLLKAVSLYLKNLETNPEDAEYWFWAASASALQEDKNKALEYLQNAIMLKPGYKKKAAEEEDFKEYYNDADFKKLTESNE